MSEVWELLLCTDGRTLLVSRTRPSLKVATHVDECLRVFLHQTFWTSQWKASGNTCHLVQHCQRSLFVWGCARICGTCPRRWVDLVVIESLSDNVAPLREQIMNSNLHSSTNLSLHHDHRTLHLLFSNYVSDLLLLFLLLLLLLQLLLVLWLLLLSPQSGKYSIDLIRDIERRETSPSLETSPSPELIVTMRRWKFRRRKRE